MDCSLLIIAAPIRALDGSELQKIDQYLAQGGRLFALFNYESLNLSTGLEPILQRWGVNVVPGYVKDPQNSIGDQVVVVRNFNPKSFVNPDPTRSGNGFTAPNRQGGLGHSARQSAAS